MVCSDLSEGILDFLSKIDESSNDAERIFGSIRSAAASFAEKTGLGRVVLSVSADPNGVEPDGISGETEFYLLRLAMRTAAYPKVLFWE